jgi:hypothetical protein
MPCRVCVQLQEALAKTQRPDSPELLLGLTEAGMRNHTHQRRERALKAETDLTKHKSACSKRDRGIRVETAVYLANRDPQKALGATESGLSLSDYPLGSRQSRAAARALLNARKTRRSFISFCVSERGVR